MNHKHKAIPADTLTFGWTTCVASGGCDGWAHGGVTHIEYCACGATRRIESNGNHTKTGKWEES